MQLEDEVAVKVDHTNGDRHTGARRFRLDALCDPSREGE